MILLWGAGCASHTPLVPTPVIMYYSNAHYILCAYIGQFYRLTVLESCQWRWRPQPGIPCCLGTTTDWNRDQEEITITTISEPETSCMMISVRLSLWSVPLTTLLGILAASRDLDHAIDGTVARMTALTKPSADYIKIYVNSESD